MENQSTNQVNKTGIMDILRNSPQNVPQALLLSYIQSRVAPFQNVAAIPGAVNNIISGPSQMSLEEQHQALRNYIDQTNQEVSRQVQGVEQRNKSIGGDFINQLYAAITRPSTPSALQQQAPQQQPQISAQSPNIDAMANQEIQRMLLGGAPSLPAASNEPSSNGYTLSPEGRYESATAEGTIIGNKASLKGKKPQASSSKENVDPMAMLQDANAIVDRQPVPEEIRSSLRSSLAPKLLKAGVDQTLVNMWVDKGSAAFGDLAKLGGKQKSLMHELSEYAMKSHIEEVKQGLSGRNREMQALTKMTPEQVESAGYGEALKRKSWIHPLTKVVDMTALKKLVESKYQTPTIKDLMDSINELHGSSSIQPSEGKQKEDDLAARIVSSGGKQKK